MTLEGLVAAQARLVAGHPILPVLAAKQASLEAGIGGEERVAEVFRKAKFSFDHRIFHDLSPTADERFQMDNFIITPWFGIILEVKNIGGVLEFKDNPLQLIRTREDGHRDGFESPVAQLQRNHECLTEWLWNRNIKLPIYEAVVLAYPKQIVTVPPANTILLYPNSIPLHIRALPRQTKKLDNDTFQWLSAEFLNSHQPYIPKPIAETYKIPFSAFQPGVRCVACGRFGMVKMPRTWHCPKCLATDPIAQQRTLREWFLIYQRSITNKECREFLRVDGIHTTTRILNSMNLYFEGTYRDRKYFMFRQE